MPNELLLDLKHEIDATVEVLEDGAYPHEIFLEWCIDQLTELNETEDLVTTYFEKKGQMVHGYSYSDHDGRLDLFGTSYNGSTEEYTLYKEKAYSEAGKILKFFTKNRESKKNEIEIEKPAYDLVEIIRNSEITLLRIFLFTEGKSTINRIEDTEVDGLPVQTHIWDLTRFSRFKSSKDYVDSTDVIFSEYDADPISCSSTNLVSNEIDTYMCVVPGDLLADIYMNFTSRLLERNVRSFLSFKSKINKGILDTIRDEPEKFIAYNNGLTAVASSIETNEDKTRISKINGFQIVNGGQTTNTVYRAKYATKIDVSHVFVPMKLCVLSQDSMDEFGPKISKFANTQNAIRRTDLVSNHPIFREIEVWSRKKIAPKKESGKGIETKWYFERTRGQYMDEVSRHNRLAEKKKFENEYPRNQKFDKGKLIKYWGVWYNQVEKVSLGLEKFMPIFIEDLTGNRSKFDQKAPEESYMRIIALAIIYEETVRIVRKNKYGDSYPSHVVNYTLALISHRSETRYDWKEIWQKQELSKDFVENICHVAEKVRDVFRKVTNKEHVMARELAYGRKVSRKSFWEILLDEDIRLPNDASSSTNTGTVILDTSPEEEDENILKVIDYGDEMLWAMAKWSKDTKSLPGWQTGIVGSVAKILGRDKLPSIKQAKQVVLAVSDAKDLGFSFEKNPE